MSQTGGAESVDGQQDYAVVGGVQPAFASKLMSLQEGTALGRRENTTKKSAAVVGGA